MYWLRLGRHSRKPPWVLSSSRAEIRMSNTVPQEEIGLLTSPCLHPTLASKSSRSSPLILFLIHLEKEWPLRTTMWSMWLSRFSRISYSTRGAGTPSRCQASLISHLPTKSKDLRISQLEPYRVRFSSMAISSVLITCVLAESIRAVGARRVAWLGVLCG